MKLFALLGLCLVEGAITVLIYPERSSSCNVVASRAEVLQALGVWFNSGSITAPATGPLAAATAINNPTIWASVNKQFVDRSSVDAGRLPSNAFGRTLVRECGDYADIITDAGKLMGINHSEIGVAVGGLIDDHIRVLNGEELALAAHEEGIDASYERLADVFFDSGIVTPMAILFPDCLLNALSVTYSSSSARGNMRSRNRGPVSSFLVAAGLGTTRAPQPVSAAEEIISPALISMITSPEERIVFDLRTQISRIRQSWLQDFTSRVGSCDGCSARLLERLLSGMQQGFPAAVKSQMAPIMNGITKVEQGILNDLSSPTFEAEFDTRFTTPIVTLGQVAEVLGQELATIIPQGSSNDALVAAGRALNLLDQINAETTSGIPGNVLRSVTAYYHEMGCGSDDGP